MENETPLATLPVDTALAKTLLVKRKDIDSECERFVRIGDPESLHDLRVAIRRMHSLFIGFAPCFKADNSPVINLKTLFKETNHARDLEVTLVLLEKHQLELPWLQQQWQKELDTEYLRLRKCLPLNWQSLSRQFDTPQHLLTKRLPSETIGTYTAMLIDKLRKKFLKRIKRVSRKWDNNRAHILRIQGKRLRYLLEPFTEEHSQANRAVSKLKRFQDQLGDYHDLVVLRLRLKRQLQGSPLNHYKALERARDNLKEQQRQLRRRICKDYSGKHYRKLSKALRAAEGELAPV